MEKEINIEKGSISLNFFFTEMSLNDEQLAAYTQSLELMALVLAEFQVNYLQLTDVSLICNLSLCSNQKITELNSQFRNKNKNTDVLSFPLQENLRKGQFDRLRSEIELGDIFICETVCREQAQRFNIDYYDEFIHLGVHGLLHLCGFDHEISPEEEDLMQGLESDFIEKISQKKRETK